MMRAKAKGRRRLAKVVVVSAGPALLFAQTLASCATFDFDGLVLITTAGGQEAQSFALVYLRAAAVVSDGATR